MEDFEEIEEHGEFGNFDTNMGFTPSPISWDVDEFGRVPVTDMFGQSTIMTRWSRHHD